MNDGKKKILSTKKPVLPAFFVLMSDRLKQTVFLWCISDGHIGITCRDQIP